MNRYKYHAKNLVWGLVWKLKHFKTVQALVSGHFDRWSEPDHQNRQGLFLALSALSGKPAVIVETGTSASGTDSSRLFDAYVRSFGGAFYSVDIDAYPSHRLRFAKSSRTNFHVMDSVEYLKNFFKISGEKFMDLVYLDSWDVDWSNPTASAEHGKRELIAIRPYLRSGTIVVVDDTPATMNWIPSSDQSVAAKFKLEYGVLPGKGAFHDNALKGIDFTIIHHGYNLVMRVR